MSKFYTYDQNNSGGIVDIDEKNGITVFVIVEADNADQANRRAEEIGLYWDGVDRGMDCECCGDRWYRADPDDPGDDTPKLEVLEFFTRYAPEGRVIAIHYLDGSIAWHKGDTP